MKRTSILNTLSLLFFCVISSVSDVVCSQPSIKKEQFLSVLSQFKRVSLGQLGDPRRWTQPANFLTSFATFTPFTQKLVVPDGARVVFVGDLHGDAEALQALLARLKKTHVLTKDLQVATPQTYMVFLGDYVDRGPSSIGVLHELMHLKIINPNNIWLLRGNHEDSLLNEHYDFAQELKNKLHLSTKERDQVYQAYNLMPTALFLGSGSPSNCDYVLCCHGGIELGYNAQKLLETSGPLNFDRIGTLRRQEALRGLPAPIKLKMLEILPEKELGSTNLTNPTSPHTLGFLWHDFATDDAILCEYAKGRGLILGQQLTQYLLAKNSSAHHQLRAIFRAHQHHGTMLDALRTGQGHVSRWDNVLHTIVSSPVVGTELNSTSCVLATTQPRYNEWQLDHIVI